MLENIVPKELQHSVFGAYYRIIATGTCNNQPVATVECHRGTIVVRRDGDDVYVDDKLFKGGEG